MRHQHRVLLFQLGGDFAAIEGLLLGCQRFGLFGIEVGLNQKAFGNLRHVIEPAALFSELRV